MSRNTWIGLAVAAVALLVIARKSPKTFVTGQSVQLVIQTPQGSGNLAELAGLLGIAGWVPSPAGTSNISSSGVVTTIVTRAGPTTTMEVPIDLGGGYVITSAA